MKGIRSGIGALCEVAGSQMRTRFSTDWGCRKPAPPADRQPYGDAAGHSCIGIAGYEPSAMTLETGSADASPTCTCSQARR